MKLGFEGIKDRAAFETAGVNLPGFDWEKMRDETAQRPRWVHFGAGNIFRGFIARLQQVLLEKGLTDFGIVAAETFDFEIIDKIYRPFDSMALVVSLLADGSMDKEVVASVAKGLRAGEDYPEDLECLREIFRGQDLQMVSYTITEKGYGLKDIHGEFLPAALSDIKNGPSHCIHAMGLTAALLYERFKAKGVPVALVSMDNCSHNGAKLRDGVLTIAEGWLKNGYVPAEFIEWLQDESKVSFPFTMIDKITPRPAKAVEDVLTAAAIEDMSPVVTSKGTYIAPFVNAERPEYLVIEDRFPNGRPALEKAGVYMTDRKTVNATERMKVTTCLNPLHTALAVFGCLLGYESIAAEMKDPELVKLVKRIGYDEGLPVVTDPGIINPRDFIREVIEERLPNPFIPDTPQRIATDTSQKMAVRFGETIKSYVAAENLDVDKLCGISMAIAGWLRYLLGIDDNGGHMQCSADPMLDNLKQQLEGIAFDNPASATEERLAPVLANTALFGTDLVAAGLSEKIIGMFRDMLKGPGAVRAALQEHIGQPT